MSNCISYESRLFEYLIPSPVVVSTMCSSHDKTELFVISLTRLLVYVIIYYLFENVINLDEHYIIKYLLFIVILINIVYMGLIVAKDPVYSISNKSSITQIKLDKSLKIMSK